MCWQTDNFRKPRLLPLALFAAAATACHPSGRDVGVAASERAEPGDASFTFPGEQRVAPPAPSLARAWVRRRAPLYKQAHPITPNVTSTASTPRTLLTHLSRAEEVALLGREQDESRVRASDGQEGFMQTAVLAEGPEVRLATLLGPSPCFVRPDLLAPKIGDARAGALLVVLRTHEGFGQIDGGGTCRGWMLSALMSFDPEEVLAAKLLNQAESLEAGLGELAQAKLINTSLYRQLIARQAPTAPQAPRFRSVPGGENVPWGPEPARPELGQEPPPISGVTGEAYEQAVVDPDAWESVPPAEEDALAPPSAPTPAAPPTSPAAPFEAPPVHAAGAE